MRILPRVAVITAATCLFIPPLTSQQNTAADRLLRARALYYTPTNSGLTSFHCSVQFDWKDFLTRFGGGKPVADDSAGLLYLKATQLSVSDDLNGTGNLTWTNTTPLVEGKEASIEQVRSGMIQMFDSFFTSWNAYMNGGMVPAPDKTVIVTPDGDGVLLRSLDATKPLTEKFDRNMLLLEADVLSPEYNITSYPTFQDSPDGRLVVSLRNLVRQPPLAPPTEITISTTYTRVGAYQLPATVLYEITNAGRFLFTFTNCELKDTKSNLKSSSRTP
jgi:hypothetical protein